MRFTYYDLYCISVGLYDLKDNQKYGKRFRKDIDRLFNAVLDEMSNRKGKKLNEKTIQR